MNSFVDWLGRIDTRWLLLFFLAVLDFWSIGLVVASEGASTRDRWLWAAVIVLCPIVGCLFWYVLGPKPDLLAREGRRRG